ncbi:MAG: hypothetical protein IJO57_03095 [Bacilli bacterium]|nr:hypothetical protein [Bacilli bacterium]
MTDEQLLAKYRKYKKKRNIIIISILLIVIISVFIFLSISNTSSKEDEKPKENTNVPEVKDEIAPEIKLSTNSIEITEGGDIDYLKYIESVIDDKDGDLLENIIYEEIDTSKIGEQKIIYTVSDSSGNTSQEVIIVNIKKKEEPVSPPKENTSSNKVETPKKEESKPSTNNNNTSNNIASPQPETPPQEETPSNPSNEKIVKYFLFKDGYTMLNVSEVCAAELKKTNRTGICSPIQDENGIYLGMKLETN